MKRGLLLTLCLALLLLFVGCGGSNKAADSASSLQPGASSTPTLVDPGLDTGASSGESAPTSDVSPGTTVVYNQYSFTYPYCLRPETDGTYHFSAVTADDFQGKNAGYEGDVITWDVYVLTSELASFAEINALPVIQDLNSSVDIPLKAGDWVYCICSLNSSTASACPEQAGTLTITPVESEFLPGANNNYQLCITANSKTNCDLDGDGTEDEVYYFAVPDDTALSGTRYGLDVNSTRFLHPELDNPAEAYGIWLDYPDLDYYYIVDLDTSDNYMEIAICDHGINDYPYTYFFRYDSGTLTCIGFVPGLPADHETVYNGDGTLLALSRLDLLQTWFAQRKYALQDGTIALVPGEFCNPNMGGYTVELLREVTVYTQPDLSSDTLTLAPSTSVTFPSTDGVNWVEVRCADGSSGWLYLSSYTTIVSGEDQLLAWDVFDGLLYAG